MLQPWGICVFEPRNAYAASSALGPIYTCTWAVGPGYYIERFQRFKIRPLIIGT